jgi:uncharacterized membrane protein
MYVCSKIYKTTDNIMSVVSTKETSSIKAQFFKYSKKSTWILIVILAIVIGFYPLTFINANPNEGLLSFKSNELLTSPLWNLAFYTHISLGGFALLIGWPLFLKKLRAKRLHLHRLIGKIYIISVLLSSLSGYYIAYHATGGIYAVFGFSGMSTAWLLTTVIAYKAIRERDFKKHERWMIRSYAVTFTGVTFRLWMPFLIIAFQMDFLEAYPINSWISWMVNLLVAELILIKQFKKKKKVPV